MGIERHVEDAGGEREPAFLVTPEGSQPAAHPDVEAAFRGDGRGEFADHQGGGQAPEQRQREQNEDGAAVSCAAQNVFNAVRPAGDHEVGGGDQGQEADLAQGGMESKPHDCECIECTWARAVRYSAGSGRACGTRRGLDGSAEREPMRRAEMDGVRRVAAAAAQVPV